MGSLSYHVRSTSPDESNDVRHAMPASDDATAGVPALWHGAAHRSRRFGVPQPISETIAAPGTIFGHKGHWMRDTDITDTEITATQRIIAKYERYFDDADRPDNGSLAEEFQRFVAELREVLPGRDANQLFEHAAQLRDSDGERVPARWSGTTDQLAEQAAALEAAATILELADGKQPHP